MVSSPGGEVGAGHQHHSDLQEGDEVAGRPVAGQEPDQPVHLIPVHFVLGCEALDLVILVVEGPHHPDAGEVFLQD